MSYVAPTWAAQPPENCSHTSQNADSHTCGHGRTGPFDSRVAFPYPAASPASIQNVDQTHTLFAVLLSDESASGEWVVSYKATVPGTYAFYLDLPGTDVVDKPPFPFELRDAFGDAVPLRLEHIVTTCPGYLAWVKIYEIDTARYHLAIGGSVGDNVQVAVEHLEAFGAALYIDADGDGHGSGAGLVSWCGAASGYSALDGDCDDEDPLAFPDVEGICEEARDPCEGNDVSVDCPSGTGGSGGTSNSEPEGTGGGQGGEFSEAPGGASGTGASSGFEGDGGGEPVDAVAGATGDTEQPDGKSPADLNPEERDSTGAGCSCQLGVKPSSEGAAWFIASLGLIWTRRRKSATRV